MVKASYHCQPTGHYADYHCWKVSVYSSQIGIYVTTGLDLHCGQTLAVD